jgi:hypothetical protein
LRFSNANPIARAFQNVRDCQSELANDSMDSIFVLLQYVNVEDTKRRAREKRQQDILADVNFP